MNVRICAVIVTYAPDISQLSSLLERLQFQVDQAVIIDNSPVSPKIERIASTTCPTKVIRNEYNRGIGHAHNQGIMLARAQGFSHVLLLDQDSFPASDMVTQLLQQEQELLTKGIRFAAVGPLVIDETSNLPEPLFGVGKWWINHQSCQQKNYCRVSYLIASGSLIRLDALTQIGLFCENLFIDLVDIEWGFRAVQKGFSLVVCCNARLQHNIGSRRMIGLGVTITSHAPERLYYQFRNFFLLLRAYFSNFSGWFFYHGFRRLLPKFFLFIFVPPMFRNFKMMLYGVRDGLTGSWPSSGTTGENNNQLDWKSGPLE